MIHWLEKQLANYNTVSTGIEEFVLKNRNAVEVMFTLAYALQQIALIICSFIFMAQLQIIISLYAVISLSTFALQKLCMEFRIRFLEDKYKSIIDEYSRDLPKDLGELEAKNLNKQQYSVDMGADGLD